MNDMVVVRPQTWQDEAGVICVMSTRRGGVSPEPLGMNLSFGVRDEPSNVEHNRSLFFSLVGVDAKRIAFARQCHSTTVALVDSPGTYERCDGFISTTMSLYLAVSVADCVPVFLFDRQRRAVGVLHAGWRGTAGQIALRGVELMHESYGSDPADVLAFIGPSVGVCCYEVKEDVATQFSHEVVKADGYKTYLDLKEANRQQLLKAGLRENNIEVHPDCTVCRPELYHSYRRDGARSGRMLGLIALI